MACSLPTSNSWGGAPDKGSVVSKAICSTPRERSVEDMNKVFGIARERIGSILDIGYYMWTLEE